MTATQPGNPGEMAVAPISKKKKKNLAGQRQPQGSSDIRLFDI
jgi:hypothetical protein